MRHFPVIRLDVDLGELEDWPSVKLGPGFTDGLVAALPGLQEHTCSYGKPGGFIRRLTEDDGTWMGHILEHVAIELQNVAGEPVTFGKTRSHGATGQYHVIYQYEQEEVGLEAGRLGLMLLHSLLPAELRPEGAVPPDFDFAAERDEFIRYAQRRHLGPSTMSLVRAAEERKIPWIRLNEQSLIQFGHGRYQQRIQATVTGRTSHIAVELASDKEETNRILGNLGLPVPRQRLVQGRGGRGGGGGGDRLSGRGEAVQREPRPRDHHPPHARRTRSGPPSRWPGSTAAASSWRASSAATTTGCW